METIPVHLIDESITVEFSEPQGFEKKPNAPAAFTWQGVTYRIVEVLEEWEDYRRKGNMDRNMTPEHRRRALLKGSWGVGRFYFRVRVEQGNLYDIYFDRAPEKAGDRKGHWFILGERRSAASE
jgi:hypothetical protein